MHGMYCWTRRPLPISKREKVSEIMCSSGKGRKKKREKKKGKDRYPHVTIMNSPSSKLTEGFQSIPKQ